MLEPRPTPTRRRTALVSLFVLTLLCAVSPAAHAHPLGNFSINHFARIEAGGERVRVHYVVDMAEIPTFQQTKAIDANADGMLSSAELDAYLEQLAPQLADKILLSINGARVPVRRVDGQISMPQGSGGLPTLRLVCDFEGATPASVDLSRAARLRYEDTNYGERMGWREIVIAPAQGASVFDSTAFGSALTDELKAYPQDMLVAPLDERTAEFSWTTGELPSGTRTLRTRDGREAVAASPDRFAALINVRELTPLAALFGLLVACGLGALHAFSPGHGKTVVGAYLVGSRGTAKHAAFLGMTVTLTHTIGVFALGLVTLFASQYVVPERLYPILSFVSGAIVVVIGLTLFIRRLRGALGNAQPAHAHHSHGDGHTHNGQLARTHDDGHAHEAEHAHGHAHTHPHGDAAHSHAVHSPALHSHAAHSQDDAAHIHSEGVHSHGGREHSHLPPGADGSPVTWRSLLGLGISGGLLPCPSALVVLLSAISLHRVGYGLALVFAFSLGLAATLTAVGLAFVYAGRFIKRPAGDSLAVRVLPVLSALVIACVGAFICFEALVQAGVDFSALAASLVGQGGAGGGVAGEAGETSLASLGAFAVLGLGLAFGLKHATEADHIVAVSTIVSEHRNIFRAALVGGLWGVGHTASLVVVGVVVLALRVTIPERVGAWMEFGIALMIIGLGLNTFVRALRARSSLHVHRHSHDGLTHAHIHFHEDGTEHVEPIATHSHSISRIGLKPLIVGAAHGLAGSAALTLLILTQIKSMVVGLLYLGVFGVGSICGMLLMSGLIGLPFALSSRRLSGVNYGLQTATGVLSIAFGLWYASGTGILKLF